MELFGHGTRPGGSMPQAWSLVEQYERGLLDTPGFFEAVASASGGLLGGTHALAPAERN